MNELIPGVAHPLVGAARPNRLRVVNARFGRFVEGVSEQSMLLSLYPFSCVTPLRYTDNTTIDAVLTLFEANPILTLAALREAELQVGHAIRSLLRPGVSWGKEHNMAVDSPDRLLEFEQIWHPEYQRYSEHVFNHLIRVPLGVLGARSGKDFHSPALSNRVAVLANNGLESLAQGFDPAIRNAISHGTTIYTDHSIVYADKRQTKEVWASNFRKYFDPLVTTCNSLVVGILLFVCRNAALMRERGLGELPFAVRYLLVKGAASHDGFDIRDAVETEIAGKPQLNIYAKSTTKSRIVHLLESLSVGVATQEFGGDRYERILIFTDPGG
ncbi:MAG TPA: hypothetical protein VFH27_14030, partial [Longimicrobiaceae bacterium]|nr:hypothetical protein [Longimicrobiaceae bacterium]